MIYQEIKREIRKRHFDKYKAEMRHFIRNKDRAIKRSALVKALLTQVCGDAYEGDGRIYAWLDEESTVAQVKSVIKRVVKPVTFRDTFDGHNKWINFYADGIEVVLYVSNTEKCELIEVGQETVVKPIYKIKCAG